MKRNYIRIIGLILCLPFIYVLFTCTITQPASLIIPCAAGAGTGLAIQVDAFVIGLFLLFIGSRKEK
ncbi:hypothetical protein [Candidatus Methanoperedens nitratireducens]|uniref:hypothetical protein n=1 Tax=Candidatus Methanoperedens nitratireducens TaxID=1392998 RepID=UPI001177601A|nr:hypothetical protein [Candidatus Methanoperedens nitroreducens]